MCQRAVVVLVVMMMCFIGVCLSMWGSRQCVKNGYNVPLDSGNSMIKCAPSIILSKSILFSILKKRVMHMYLFSIKKARHRVTLFALRDSQDAWGCYAVDGQERSAKQICAYLFFALVVMLCCFFMIVGLLRTPGDVQFS
jgi:hypothetical protein